MHVVYIFCMLQCVTVFVGHSLATNGFYRQIAGCHKGMRGVGGVGMSYLMMKGGHG